MIGWDGMIPARVLLFDALVLAALFAAAVFVRSRSSLLKRYLIPSSLIAGFLGFLLGPAVMKVVAFRTEDMAFYVYHLLALTFIVVGLRASRSRAGVDAFHVGFVKTVSVIVQALTGLAILYAFHVLVDRSVSPAVGMLLPLGFGMGPGIALSVGASWEAYGIAGAADAGLAMATAGFLVAYVVGVWAVNRGVRDGLVLLKPVLAARSETDDLPGVADIVPDAADAGPARTAAESPEVLLPTVWVIVALLGCVATVYFVTFLLMSGASRLMLDTPFETEIPVLWSLNFLWASLVAIAFRVSTGRLPVLRRVYSHPLLNRIVAILADVLVATAVMAIGLTLSPAYFAPLVLSCLLGTLVTYYIVRDSTRWAFKEHAFIRFAGLFGEQTGAVSSGLALVRLVDPGYQTPVARDQVLGSGTALLLGFPLLLLINLPITRFGGSGVGYALVAVLLGAYLLATVLAWRFVHRRFG